MFSNVKDHSGCFFGLARDGLLAMVSTLSEFIESLNMSVIGSTGISEFPFTVKVLSPSHDGKSRVLLYDIEFTLFACKF